MVFRRVLVNDAKTPLRKAETAVFLWDNQNKDGDAKMTLDVFTANSEKSSMRQKKVKDEETRASNFSSAVRLTKSRRRAMFAPSVFGIDGSSTPAVKSWGYQSSFSLRKPASSGLPERLKSREEALKNDNEGLMIRCGNLAAKPQKRTSLSSPCFSSSSTSWMGKNRDTTHRGAFKQGTGLTRSLSLPDVTIKKINLNKRPKGKIVTNQERECFTRFSEVLQSKRDLTYASDYIQRETNRMLDVSVWKTKLGFQDGEEVVFQEKEFEEKKAIKHDSCFQSTQISINEPDFYTASLRVRKIDIKLPCLGQESERK